jgi:hypothetical protein
VATNFLADMPADDRRAVMTHPVQQACVELLGKLIRELRGCRTFEQFDNFQRRLFQYVLEVESHWGEVRRCQKRLLRGKALTFDATKLPEGSDPQDPWMWHIEDLVAERMCRQFRAIGDALAWRASGNDRSYILALNYNAAPGPMTSKEGVGYELRAVTDMRARGQFGLLHDLTNCLRIADITEFDTDGGKLLYEIKKNPNAKRGPQLRRMAAAVEAVMSGGELPNLPGSAFARPSTRCRTHIRSFASVIREAQQHAIASVPLPGRRAIVAMSASPVNQSGKDVQGVLDEWTRRRFEALQLAGALHTAHHITLSSAVRNHNLVPWIIPFALYPLPPEDCALLICDYILFEVIMDLESLVQALARQDITAESHLEHAAATLQPTDTVLSLRKGSRGMTLTQGALYELMMEFYEVNTWAAAIAEVLDNPASPKHPVLAFSTTRVWR